MSSLGESWIPGGPLSKAYRIKILDDFIGDHSKLQTKFVLHDYLPEDLPKIEAKMIELVEFLGVCNHRAQASRDTSKSYGMYLSFKRYRWNLDQFLEKR